jgi:hypothetical protein
MLIEYASHLPETRIKIMRHQLPSTRHRHLAALLALVALVTVTSLAMAHADTAAPAQAQTQQR